VSSVIARFSRVVRFADHRPFPQQPPEQAGDRVTGHHLFVGLEHRRTTLVVQLYQSRVQQREFAPVEFDADVGD